MLLETVPAHAFPRTTRQGRGKKGHVPVSAFILQMIQETSAHISLALSGQVVVPDFREG